MSTPRGQLVVLSGPSGVGKGTIHRRLRQVRDDLTVSVSATTRLPRPGEVEGVDYHFVPPEHFAQMVADGAFLEHAVYAGNSYGTPRQEVEAALLAGQIVVLDIEVQGAMQVRAAMPDALLVMLLPPSLEELERRLRNRGTEDDAAVRRRLERAIEELTMREVFDVTVVNDDVDRCVDEILAAIDAAHARTTP